MFHHPKWYIRLTCLLALPLPGPPAACRPEPVALGLQHTWHPEHPFPHLLLCLGRAPLCLRCVPSFWGSVASGCCMLQDAVLCLSPLFGWDMVVLFQLVLHLQGLVLVP